MSRKSLYVLSKTSPCHELSQIQFLIYFIISFVFVRYLAPSSIGSQATWESPNYRFSTRADIILLLPLGTTLSSHSRATVFKSFLFPPVWAGHRRGRIPIFPPHNPSSLRRSAKSYPSTLSEEIKARPTFPPTPLSGDVHRGGVLSLPAPTSMLFVGTRVHPVSNRLCCRG